MAANKSTEAQLKKITVVTLEIKITVSDNTVRCYSNYFFLATLLGQTNEPQGGYLWWKMKYKRSLPRSRKVFKTDISSVQLDQPNPAAHKERQILKACLPVPYKNAQMSGRW